MLPYDPGEDRAPLSIYVETHGIIRHNAQECGITIPAFLHLLVCDYVDRGPSPKMAADLVEAKRVYDEWRAKRARKASLSRRPKT